MNQTIYIGVNNNLIFEGLQAILKQIDSRFIIEVIKNQNDLLITAKREANPVYFISNQWHKNLNSLNEKKIMPRTIFVLEDQNFPLERAVGLNSSKKEILLVLQDFLPPVEKDKESLSPREKDVLKWVVNGLSNKQIADKLNISIHTVITHRKNITNKLEIKSVSGLTIYAILNNLK